MDHDLAELLRGGGAALALRVLGLLIGYAFVLRISRSGGADAVGVFALYFTVLQVATTVASLGLDTAIIKLVAPAAAGGEWGAVRTAYRKVVAVGGAGGVATAVAVAALAPLLAQVLFHDASRVPVVLAAAVAVVPSFLVGTNAEAYRGVKEAGVYSFYRNAAVGLVALVAYELSTYGSPEMAPVLAYTLATFVVAGWSTVRWSAHPRLRGTGSSAAIPTLGLLTLSLPMLLSSATWLVLGWTDTVMLGVMRTEAEVGVYSVALKLAPLVTLPLLALNALSAPKIAELHAARETERLRALVRNSARLVFWTSLPLMAVVIGLSGPILRSLGPEFVAGRSVLVLLLLGQCVNALSGPVGHILQMTGRQRVFQNLLLAAAVANVALNALLIPDFGIVGAAAGNVVGMALWNVGSVLYIWHFDRLSTVYVPRLPAAWPLPRPTRVRAP